MSGHTNIHIYSNGRDHASTYVMIVTTIGERDYNAVKSIIQLL